MLIDAIEMFEGTKEIRFNFCCSKRYWKRSIDIQLQDADNVRPKALQKLFLKIYLIPLSSKINLIFGME